MVASYEGRVMGNTILTSAQIDALADLPPRECVESGGGYRGGPADTPVGVLKQKVSTIVYVLKAIEDKKNVTK